jgi:hypothetical protein
MNPEYIIFEDIINGDFFIVTLDRVSRYPIPKQYKQISTHNHVKPAMIEMKRLQKLRDAQIPEFLREQAS